MSNSNFFIEISMDGENKTISLDIDNAEIYIYQKQGGEQIRILEIGCVEKSGIFTTLETKCEYVGNKGNEVMKMHSGEEIIIRSKK